MQEIIPPYKLIINDTFGTILQHARLEIIQQEQNNVVKLLLAPLVINIR